MSCIQVIFTVILNNVILFNNLLWNSYFENPIIEFSIHTHTHTHIYIYIYAHFPLNGLMVHLRLA